VCVYAGRPGVHSNVWITNQAAFSDKSQPSGNLSTERAWLIAYKMRGDLHSGRRVAYADDHRTRAPPPFLRDCRSLHLYPSVCLFPSFAVSGLYVLLRAVYATVAQSPSKPGTVFARPACCSWRRVQYTPPLAGRSHGVPDKTNPKIGPCPTTRIRSCFTVVKINSFRKIRFLIIVERLKRF